MVSKLDLLRAEDRFTTLFSYLLVAAMMACLMLTLTIFLQALVPGWSFRGLVAFGFVVSLETFYTQRLRKDLVSLGGDWFFFYAGELLVLLLSLKILLVLGSPGGIPAELAALRLDFWSALFSRQFLFGLVAVGIIWLLSLSFAAPLEVLRAIPQDLELEQQLIDNQERALARQGLVDLLLVIGVAMVILTSLLRYPRITIALDISLPAPGVMNILAYFALALVLLSLTQYNVLQQRWTLNRLPVSSHISRRWAGYSLVMLILLVGVTLLLPTRFGLPLLTMLGWFFGMLVAVGQLILWLLMLPVVLLGALLGGGSIDGAIIPPAPLPAPAPASPSGEMPGALAVLRDLALWTAIIGVVLYSLVYFLRVRRVHIAQLRRFPLVNWLFNLLSSVLSWLKGSGRAAGNALRRAAVRFQPPAVARPTPERWGYLRLRHLSARQQVLFYYLALLRRSAESGIPRRASQTPNEYAALLARSLQSREEQAESEIAIHPDVQAITEQFSEARYSRHAITGEQAQAVRVIWERLRKLFHRSSSPTPEP